ncbi:hypothetical protein HAX54_019688, partial [Datura stramonium]|nr:hypothetical protein [Datura stramonium]
MVTDRDSWSLELGFSVSTSLLTTRQYESYQHSMTHGYWAYFGYSLNFIPPMDTTVVPPRHNS